MPTSRRLIPLVVAVAVAVIAPAATSGASDAGSTPQASAASLASREAGIRRCVNRERAERGLALLRFDPDLAKAARMQARSMAAGGYVGHVDEEGRDPADRVELFTDRFGPGVGENAAAGLATARATCAQWMGSPGHRRNILNPDYRFIGTGYAAGGRWRHSWVQVFALPPQ